jgi:hypothetical protein
MGATQYNTKTGTAYPFTVAFIVKDMGRRPKLRSKVSSIVVLQADKFRRVDETTYPTSRDTNGWQVVVGLYNDGKWRTIGSNVSHPVFYKLGERRVSPKAIENPLKTDDVELLTEDEDYDIMSVLAMIKPARYKGD